MTNLPAALALLRAGFSIVPLRPRAKRPMVPWVEFQRRRATEDEALAWWRSIPEAGVGIVCGRVSSLIVLDEDPRNGGTTSLHALPVSKGPTVRTGGGGRHLYFALNGEQVSKVGALLPGVDLLGDGALATAPPSVHPNGKTYSWEPGCALGDVPLPSLPFWLRGLLSDRRRAAGRPAAHLFSSGAIPHTVEELLGRLEGIRRTATGWTARCPAHADHDPSLSVGVGQGGRLLLHCFAGCRFDEILTTLKRQV